MVNKPGPPAAASAASAASPPVALWLVLLAAGTYSLIMGTRQSMGLS